MARAVATVEHESARRRSGFGLLQADRLQFSRIYGVPPERIKLIPDGVFTSRIQPADATQRRAARTRHALPQGPIAIFLGSNYGPNVEAALFIAKELAPCLPTITFLIAGGVGEGLRAELKNKLPRNVRTTGLIDDSTKFDLLAASDVAVNPMFSGSGTNIKMFDFMAAGLPVVATPVGARGIETSRTAFLTCEKAAFSSTLRELVSNEDQRAEFVCSGTNGDRASLFLGTDIKKPWALVAASSSEQKGWWRNAIFQRYRTGLRAPRPAHPAAGSVSIANRARFRSDRCRSKRATLARNRSAFRPQPAIRA